MAIKRVALLALLAVMMCAAAVVTLAQVREARSIEPPSIAKETATRAIDDRRAS